MIAKGSRTERIAACCTAVCFFLKGLIFCEDPAPNRRCAADLPDERGCVPAFAFPVPGSVLAMVVLFILLVTGILKVDHIRQKSDFMLKNMAFFFIPAGVGIMEYFDVLRECLLPFLVICVISTVLTFAVTAGTVALVMKLQRMWDMRRKEKRNA